MQCKTARKKGTGRLSVSCIYSFIRNVPSKPWYYNMSKGVYFLFVFAWDSVELGFVH